MKKIISILLVLLFSLAFAGCGISELLNDNEGVVDLGNGKESVKWTLVQNDNQYSAVKSAYFEFNEDTFKYYEDGVLKKEGTHRIVYSGVQNTISPLHLNLNFGNDENGNAIFDYIDCYTEDTEAELKQFTIMSEGYKIKPPRQGGVPIRDYHLSNMPYALGTYVKEGYQKEDYQNGKANYLDCSKLDGTFADENGNKLYFLNNAYSSDSESVHYTIYMRYENNIKGTFLEATIKMSYKENYKGEREGCALIYETHGEGEPSEESGASVEADFILNGFEFIGNDAIKISGCDQFAEKTESQFNPADFVGATYTRVK